jgi:outer membrane protein insertion porin family
MRACLRTGLLSVLLLVIFCVGVLAQRYSVGKIVFSGTDLSQGELLAFTGLRQGEQVTRDQMQEAATRLTETGLFADTRFSLDGETLTFELKASPAVAAVRYENFPWWDDKTLNAAVAAKVPLFHGAIDPGGPMRDEVKTALTSLLVAKDVRGSVIRTAPVGDANGNQVAIAYRIESPRVVLGAFHIEGYSGVWTGPLQEIEKGALGQVFAGSAREKLADAVRAVYGRQGFIDVTMTEPEWGTPLLVNGAIAVPVRMSIQSEGGQYHVSGIHLNGDVFMTQEQFAERARLHAGDVANQELWAQVREMVTAPYKTHGYLDAKIDATPMLDRAAHTVDYTITVQAGPVYRVGALTLGNLSAAQKAELMPYWRLKPGDVFNAELIPESVNDYHRSRAADLQSIRGGFAAKWTVNQDSHTVDVVVTFEMPKN